LNNTADISIDQWHASKHAYVP